MTTSGIQLVGAGPGPGCQNACYLNWTSVSGRWTIPAGQLGCSASTTAFPDPTSQIGISGSIGLNPDSASPTGYSGYVSFQVQSLPVAGSGCRSIVQFDATASKPHLAYGRGDATGTWPSNGGGLFHITWLP